MNGIRRISRGWIVGARSQWQGGLLPLSDDEMAELCKKLFSGPGRPEESLSKRERKFRQELLRMRDNGTSMPFDNFGGLQWSTSNRLDVNEYGARGSHIQDVGVIKRRPRG